MPRSKLNLAQQRQESIARITHADLMFFKRFPHRKLRVRVPGRAEIEEAELSGMDMSLAPGLQHYVAVLSLSPHSCNALLIHGPKDADPDLFDEQTVRALYKKAAPRIDVHGVSLTVAELLAIAEVYK